MLTYKRVKNVNWQPTLFGHSVRLRPLVQADFEELFAAASDPLIWEQHPDNKRHTRERFELYFRSAMDSKGAVVIIDPSSGKIIGSSRYTHYDAETSSVEIGYTFLTRSHWGGTTNRELKSLMLNHAFKVIDTVYFVVGRDNFRSRKAMQKLGAHELLDVSSSPVTGDLSRSIVFQLKKSSWPDTTR